MEKLRLRRLSKGDINQTYLGWLNDAKVTKYMVTKSSTLEQLNAFYWHVSNSYDNVIFAIIDNKTDKHIGNIKIGSIDWKGKTAAIGIMIGEKSYWNQGYGTQAIRMATDKATRFLLHTVFAGIEDENIGSIKACKKVGYKVGQPSPRGHWYWYKPNKKREANNEHT